MADPTPKAPAKKPSPFPGNWARMSAAEKRAWQAQNRPQPVAAVKPAQPMPPSPKQPVPAQQPATGAEQPAEEPYEEPGDGTELEPCNEEVIVTIKMPGQDVREMTGREFVRRILGGLYDAFGGAGGIS